MFELVENRLYAYADDSTLLAVVRKPVDRPSVALSFNRGLARIQEWCNHWCMILNLNKTKVLVLSRSRTVSPPHGDNWSCLGFPFALVPTLTFLAWSLTAGWPSKTMCVVMVTSVSMNWDFEVGEACLCGHLCVVSLLLCICSPNPWVMFSGAGVCCWMSSLASQAPGVFDGQALPDQSFLL